MPAKAELTANGHSSMTSSSLALAAVLMDEPTGAGGNSESLGIELLQRATRDDYDRWLNTALAAGGCIRPVRLRGTVRDVDTTTGEILHGLDTEDLPDKAMYVPARPRQGPPFICLSSRVTLYSAHDVQRWLAARRIDPGQAA